MKKILLAALVALTSISAFTACATHENSGEAQSVRTGSGGRGMSPAQEVETNRGAR